MESSSTPERINSPREDCTVSVAGKHDDGVTLKPFLSIPEFYRQLGGTVGTNSLYGLVRSGRIKSIKVGRKILIPRSELIDFPAREAA